MVYYRAVKFYISFICITEDGREVFREYGRMVNIEPYDFVYKKYDTKKDADARGPLDEWAKRVADKRAEKDAKDYCGEGTIFADDWDYTILDVDEGRNLDKLFKPKVPKKKPPKDIKEKKKRIERIIKQKRAELEKLQREIEELEEEYEF